MRSLSSNPNKRQQIKLTKKLDGKNDNTKKELENRGTSLTNFFDLNNKNFFVNKNKNVLLDYDRYLQVKREREKGIVFSSLKKISYEEKKKNETFNLYNKFPFNEDPRHIIINYNLSKDYTIEEKTVSKNRILGVDEGLIKLPKFNKESNYLNLFLGHNAFERNLFNNLKDEKDEKERTHTIGENLLNARRNIFSGNRKKNPMLLDRGQELFSYYANLENRFKSRSEKNIERMRNLIEYKKYKSIEKKKENYENNLIYNYQIKCLDNWDFEHITKNNDLKNDSKFKKFLDDVDNSQMKWIIEIKNDKEQLKLMRRNKHLFNFLTQIDREQQAMVMQNMSLYKKGFNFDIFNNENEPKEKNKEIVCKTENNNVSTDLILNEEEIPNNVSQVEFYRQVIKEKKKLEEMFHGEVRAVAEQCYLTNINKKKCVVESFDILQELTVLSKKEETCRQTYNNKIKELQKKKKRDRKKKNADTKNNMGSIAPTKQINFLSGVIKTSKKDLRRQSSSEDDKLSDKSTSKSINFQKQSLYLAEKNSIEKEYKTKVTEIAQQKDKLNEQYKKLNKEVKYWDAIHKKEKSKLEQRIKALSTYYYQILKKGIDVRHTGLTWVIVRLLELGAFVDKPHFPSFLNEEQILYLMKIGTKTYELSEFIKLFQILKKKQKTLREKHINDNIKKEKMNEQKRYRRSLKKRQEKNFIIGDFYMEYIEEIQRKYENVINICLNENKEESNIAKISHDLKQYILQDKANEEIDKNGDNKRLELLFIPGSLSEYFAQDKRFRQYFDDVFYLNDEINKRRSILSKEKQEYLNQYRSKILRGSLFGHADIVDKKYKRKKSKESEIVYAALFGNGISI